MNGGTYSEALKVGFNEQQAGMLGRLTAETRTEAVQDVIDWYESKVCRERLDRAEKIRHRLYRAFCCAVLVGAGILVGKAFA